MKRKALFVDLTIYERIAPLAFGYMHAYACRTPSIKKTYFFEYYSSTVTTNYSKILYDLQKSEANVYAFSCYVWNTGLVKRLVELLSQTNPRACIILGGPQVMNLGDKYLIPTQENIVLANDSGERIFRNYLLELCNERPDYSNIRGISFYRNRELITNDPEDIIRNLDEIPSPFLNNIFEKHRYAYSVFETNRGCPYGCTYCFHGKRTRGIQMFDKHRVKEELTWLSRNDYVGLFIGDSNWGMFERDLEFSMHIAELKRKYGLPLMTIFSTEKSKPERTVRIFEILENAGLKIANSIAFQSLNAIALRNVSRNNIEMEKYLELQRILKEKKINSYVELIWPLPGETLYSFKEGVGKLCKMEAESFSIYPFVLLNNTAISQEREKHGLVTISSNGCGSETELVAGTHEVDYDQYIDGIWFSFAVLVLYNARVLYCLGKYLDSSGIMSYADLFSEFANFCRNDSDSSIASVCREALENHTHFEFSYWGETLHKVLHICRSECDRWVLKFVSLQRWWNNDDARVWLEIDLLNRPYVYNTGVAEIEYSFEQVRILDVGPFTRDVCVPEKYLLQLDKFVEICEAATADSTSKINISYKRKQHPYMPKETLQHNAEYCHWSMNNVRQMMPIWSNGIK